jgi:hypothetical protein
MSQQTLEERDRRLVHHLGLRIEKSRTRRHYHHNDQGGFMIIKHDGNEYVAGERYDLDLAE